MTQNRILISQLKDSFLFRGLPEEDLATLADKAGTRSLKSGDVLIRKGDSGDSLFMIHEGWMRILTEDSKGEALIINKCGPGETIGEMALLDEAPRSATVVAETDAEVLELRREVFLELLDQRPDLALALIRSYSLRLRFSTTYIQKAIEWSQKIAAGDYSFMDQSQGSPSESGSDEDKAGQLLAAFFQMVQGVKQREDNLKQQLQKLSIEIDESRRRQEFEEITGTDFYANLKEQAKRLRAQREDKD